MIPISSKRRQRTNHESQAIISTKSKMMMIEVITSNTHDTQDDKTTISTTHPNQTQTPTTVQCCSICNKNIARYKCPRCNISYCSISCYQVHDGTSSNTTDSPNNRKLCTESLHKRHVLTSNITANDVNRVQSVLSNINNEININLDKLEQRNEHISKLISKNEQGGGGEIVNGMIEEIKDNVCKSESLLDVFRIDQLNNNSKFENSKDHTFGDEDKDMNQNRRVVNSMSTQLNKVEDVSSTKQDRIQEQDVKKDELSIDLLISGMNAMDSGNDTSDDRDMLSSGVLNLGLGNSNHQIRPLVVEDEMVSISTIHKK